MTALKSPYSSASVPKTSSHKLRRRKTAKHWFCWIPRKCWAKMVSEVRKYGKWLCCEIFVTKSKLEASLAVWRNLLPHIFQGGLQPGSPLWQATPGYNYNGLVAPRLRLYNFWFVLVFWMCSLQLLRTPCAW